MINFDTSREENRIMLDKTWNNFPETNRNFLSLLSISRIFTFSVTSIEIEPFKNQKLSYLLSLKDQATCYIFWFCNIRWKAHNFYTTQKKNKNKKTNKQYWRFQCPWAFHQLKLLPVFTDNIALSFNCKYYLLKDTYK